MVVTEEAKKIGSWTLHEELGSGGNAKVYRATRRGVTGPVALKVIDSTKAQKERYRRFVREVEFLRKAGNEPGILPLLDSHLPNRPSRSDRAWLAMPIATPIREALADASLDEVVSALAEIAETLARLKEAHQLAHRDLKPGNLYELDGHWLVGDFGLIALPDVDELTRQERPIGPAHYTAYELINNPADADPFPADVYSLGKTLWVLATGQTYPPLGNQRADTRDYSIADLRPHTHAQALDQLVDRATRIHAQERPTMQQVATDLRAWRNLGATTAPLDVSDYRARLHARLQPEFAAEDLLEQRKELALAAVRRLQELMRQLNEALRQVYQRAEIDSMGDKYAQNVLTTYRSSGAPEIVFTHIRTSRISSGPEYAQYQLTIGRGLELTDGGALIFRAFAEVDYRGLAGSDFTWQAEEREAEVGSIEADKMLEEGVSELAAKLKEALAVYVEKVPSRGD
jgi:serine/threonine protein kinase